MYPDQNQNQQQYQPPTQPDNETQPQYSIDYLNQIAPTPKKPGLFNNRILVFIAGGGLLLTLIVLVLTLANSGSGPTQKLQTFAARIQTLEKITNDEQKNIKSNDLRGINSNLNIFLTNTESGMKTPLANNNVKVGSLDKTITQAESGDALTAKLDDARLNAVFDRTYAREMSYQLAALEALMRSLYSTTSSKSLKTFLQETDDTLVPIKKQLDAFNASSV